MKAIFEGYKWQYHIKDGAIMMIAHNEGNNVIARHEGLNADEVQEVLVAEARAMKIRAEHWLEE